MWHSQAAWEVSSPEKQPARLACMPLPHPQLHTCWRYQCGESSTSTAGALRTRPPSEAEEGARAGGGWCGRSCRGVRRCRGEASPPAASGGAACVTYSQVRRSSARSRKRCGGGAGRQGLVGGQSQLSSASAARQAPQHPAAPSASAPLSPIRGRQPTNSQALAALTRQAAATLNRSGSGVRCEKHCSSRWSSRSHSCEAGCWASMAALAGEVDAGGSLQAGRKTGTLLSVGRRRRRGDGERCTRCGRDVDIAVLHWHCGRCWGPAGAAASVERGVWSAGALWALAIDTWEFRSSPVVNLGAWTDRSSAQRAGRPPGSLLGRPTNVLMPSIVLARSVVMQGRPLATTQGPDVLMQDWGL